MKQFAALAKNFWKDEEGLQTLEMLLIIAIVVFIALLFRNQIINWTKQLFGYGTNEIKQFQK